jgi:hypothetical protein
METLNDSIRPYATIATEHEDPIATIILYNQNAGKGLSTANSRLVDYLKSYSKKIDDLSSGAINSSVIGAPELAGGDIPMLSLNSGDDYYGVFNNFSLTSMSESHDQITKVHMNFSARWNVFFFGDTPKMYQFRGVFLDSKEYPYYQEFLVAYEKYLSGRKCVEKSMQTKLMVSGQIIDGYLLNVAVNHNANTPTLKEFSFTMLVKGVSWVRINSTHKGGIDEGLSGKNQDVFNGLSNLNRIGYSEDGNSAFSRGVG